MKLFCPSWYIHVCTCTFPASFTCEVLTYMYRGRCTSYTSFVHWKGCFNNKRGIYKTIWYWKSKGSGKYLKDHRKWCSLLNSLKTYLYCTWKINNTCTFRSIWHAVHINVKLLVYKTWARFYPYEQLCVAYMYSVCAIITVHNNLHFCVHP